MKIEFDLQDAEIYLPQGRIMNLKSELGWDKQVEKIQNNFSCLDITTDMFSPILPENFIHQCMSKSVYFEASNNWKKQRLIEVLGGSINKGIMLESLPLDDIKDSLSDIAIEVKSLPEIAEKFEKLSQLKLLNKGK